MSAPPGPTLRTLAEDVGFSEGPVVGPDGTVFVTSITHGRVYRMARTGAELWADVGGGANGAALGADGRLFVAQNGGRWARNGPAWTPDSVGGIQVVAADQTVSWVTREPIAPNDLCFGPDGFLYVTDPTRAPRSSRPSDGRLWRVHPDTGATELLRSVRWFPNGIAFGPDERLYVADTHGTAIYRFDVLDEGLSDEVKIIDMTRGAPDGMAFDDRGDLVVGAIEEGDDAGTLQTWSVDGTLVRTFEPGPSRAYTNVAFTDADALVIADSSGGRVLLAESWPTGGLPLHPFR